MKITMESTDKITMVAGVPARLWAGVSAGGVPCHVFVHRLAVHEDEQQAEFDRELEEMSACTFVPIGEIMATSPEHPSARTG
jgi:hypothetical protein